MCFPYFEVSFIRGSTVFVHIEWLVKVSFSVMSTVFCMYEHIYREGTGRRGRSCGPTWGPLHPSAGSEGMFIVQQTTVEPC